LHLTATTEMGDETLKIAVLGPLGTYTHEAALKRFGNEFVYDEQPSISDIFQALCLKVPIGVVPRENSIFGTVVETYDLLKVPDAAFIRGEITLKVEHCLLVRKGVQLNNIRRILSHEQALGQCRDFINRNLPSVSLVKTASTAAAAQALLDNPPDCAAICSAVCTTLFDGLEVLFTGIQNQRSNFTRFYVIAKNSQAIMPPILGAPTRKKALIHLSAHSPCSVEPCDSDSLNVMKYLNVLDLYTTSIDRRPAPNSPPFQNVYLVEVSGCDREYASVDSWIADVEQAILRVRNIHGEAKLMGVW